MMYIHAIVLAKATNEGDIFLMVMQGSFTVDTNGYTSFTCLLHVYLCLSGLPACSQHIRASHATGPSELQSRKQEAGYRKCCSEEVDSHQAAPLGARKKEAAV